MSFPVAPVWRSVGIFILVIGKGYATEAAREVMRWGFEEKGLDEIVAFAVPENSSSIRIMDKLGMTHDPGGDFNHPALPEDHRLSRHILYRKNSSCA